MGCRFSLAALFAVAALGCSSKEFQGDGGDSGMGGTATGGSGPNGGAGMANGGSSGSAGNATGGSGGMACSCPPTEYCRGGECQPCSELATLDFGEPELVLDDPSRSLRFPRVGDTPSSLFYRAGNDGSGRLFYTANASTLGVAIGNDAVPEQSGPLFVRALGRSFDFIFDQTNNPTSADGRIMRATTWNGSSLTGETDMPAPLSPGGHKDYSAAAATTTMPPRLFWMSTRDGPPRLRTGSIDTGEGNVVDIDVPKRSGTGTCVRDGDDATPWVTPEGHRMFFRSFPLGDSCQALDATTTDLFVVPLVPGSGVPTLPAVALASLNEVGSTETDPSLSADFCAIYFASDRGSPGDFKLYRAARR
jgi:hypothetical protein